LLTWVQETMHVTPENEQDLLSMSDERKWKLVRGEVSVCVCVCVCVCVRVCACVYVYVYVWLTKSDEEVNVAATHGLLSLTAQMQRRVQQPPEYFSDQLRRHLDPELK
jgi:hypothetical protein